MMSGRDWVIAGTPDWTLSPLPRSGATAGAVQAIRLRGRASRCGCTLAACGAATASIGKKSSRYTRIEGRLSWDRMSEDAAALAAQRERDRQLAIRDTSDLCEYVVQMDAAGHLGRRRAGGVPIVPGGRLWLAVKMYFDHRPTFDAARSGEYESISAAGRSAGIAAAMPRRRITLGPDPDKWARQLFHALSPRGASRRRRRAHGARRGPRAEGCLRRSGATAPGYWGAVGHDCTSADAGDGFRAGPYASYPAHVQAPLRG